MKTKNVVNALIFMLLSCISDRAEDAVVPVAADDRAAFDAPLPAVPMPTTVVPAPSIDFSPPQAYQPTRRGAPEAKSAASAQLETKLAELEQLQKEIDELRIATQTPAQILVRIEAIEVNLTKAQQSKFDVSAFTDGSGAAISDAAKNSNQQADQLERDQKAILKKLIQNNIAKVITRPNIVVLSGRPATFNVGGEFQVPTAQNNGVEFRQFGTKVDLLAESLGNNKVRIHFRPRISELDQNHQIVVNGTTVPGLSVRECDSTIELAFGQTAILSGLIDRDMSGEGAKKGEPVETMLAFAVTPEAVGAIPHSPPTLKRISNKLFAPVPAK